MENVVLDKARKERILYYNFVPQTYLQSQEIIFKDNCNGFEVVNIGATIARINGRPLYPGTPGTSIGDSYTVGGNKGEIFKGRVDLTFDTGAGIVLFTQKIYLVELNDVYNKQL